ncbi:pirin family protein [Paraburkholderia sp. G-4-1-8]|uniref:Pirin family protein n=1 Tax=Paraburkholderia antibiotica TaxID=2728839 RepID=A0A7Y0A2F4_9BURK|nr:pirin family protein [Paraburkholderia antibiotica]
MHLLRALPQSSLTAVGPFVFVDHYRHEGLRGIGDRPHPHAGIDVVSYLFKGVVEHRDSMGSHDRLGPGDAQVIRAGRGMLHAERPLSGRHGLQLCSACRRNSSTWSRAMRRCAPRRFRHAKATARGSTSWPGKSMVCADRWRSAAARLSRGCVSSRGLWRR